VTRPSWLWLSLGGSALTHGVLGWQLSNAPLSRHAPPDRDTFEVRMVTLPPPEPEPVRAPEPPPPEPPPPPKVKPPPKPKTPPPPAPQLPAAQEPAPLPEPTTAPPALLAESGFAMGSIVQRAGASIGALATASPLPPPPPAPAAERPRGAPLAKLSDLSRKPRAPSLDAALRQNYPVEQRRRGTEGQAEVRVIIDRLGRVGEVAIVSESAAGFADACRKTLLGSRWSEPLDREGQPVSTRLTYRCRFEIEK
jgi:periplasmic protein TonB